MAASRRGAEPGQAWVHRAWKWGAGSLSAGAALVSIISSVRSITGSQQVRWIGVAPAADTAWAIGDTIQLATTITDGHGGVLPGVSVGWTSTDTSVAAVDSAGTVVARAPGAATVVAAAGGRIAQSRILVRPRPAAIRFFGDSLLRLPEGAVARVVARVVDARRSPVPGQTIAWRSADSTVAAFDTAGRLTAVSSGHTVLAASGGDLVAELPLDVYPAPSNITLLAGDGQHAPAGRGLPVALRAQVVSRGGRPMAAVPVRFNPGDAGGRVEPEIDTTDADGIARAEWTLGPRPGRQRLALGVQGDRSITTFVVAEADPLPDNTRLVPLSGTLEGSAGQQLNEPVRIRVTDSSGAPLAEVPVAWQTGAGGNIVAEADRTDSLGEVHARWTLGPRSGTQHAYAQVGTGRNISHLGLTATALPGPAVALAVLRAAPLRGEVGRPVAPVGLRVSDEKGNPVPGVTVTVKPSSGSVKTSAPAADSLGRVTLVWTLGSTAGAQRLVASAPGIAKPVEIVAQARPGGAAGIALEGVPPTATAGRPLAKPVTVVVTDAYGNAVPGALVVLSSRGGKVSPSRVSTDSTGRAQAQWALGSKPGEQVLEAALRNGGKRATAKVRAVKPHRAP